MSDLIDGLVRVMRAPSGIIGPMNIGNPGEFQIRELAEMVIDLTGSRSDIIFKPLPTDDPKQRKPDIRQATEQLSWHPTVKLREGLIKTIAYFEHELAGRAASHVVGEAEGNAFPPTATDRPQTASQATR